jgi:hypothetical protein
LARNGPRRSTPRPIAVNPSREESVRDGKTGAMVPGAAQIGVIAGLRDVRLGLAAPKVDPVLARSRGIPHRAVAASVATIQVIAGPPAKAVVVTIAVDLGARAGIPAGRAMARAATAGRAATAAGVGPRTADRMTVPITR